eukprot:m.307304 g.307304  ORF g.307304 m.307304 type:complete len:116 (-) comp16458_c1_seq2:350-697(-)
MQLLQPREQIHLLKACYGILMMLPQTCFPECCECNDDGTRHGCRVQAFTKFKKRLELAPGIASTSQVYPLNQIRSTKNKNDKLVEMDWEVLTSYFDKIQEEYLIGRKQELTNFHK